MTALVALVVLCWLEVAHAEPPVLRRSDGAPGEYEAVPLELAPLPDDARQLEPPPFPVAEINGPFVADDRNALDENTEPDVAEAEPDAPEDERRLDEINLRAPVDRSRQTSWGRLNDAIKQQQWDRVPGLHERVLDRTPAGLRIVWTHG